MNTAPVVIVGASLAGLRTVEAFRRAGDDGPLTLVGAEPHLPYDRPPLSKQFLDPAEPPTVPTYRDESQLRDLGVELLLGVPATGLDTDTSEVVLDDRHLPYRTLVIATGAHARTLPDIDSALEGVHTLRTVDDAAALRRDLDAARRAVVVGGGFIGSEVAAAARKRGLEVTIVEAAPRPLVRAVGEQMAQACSSLHARNGTELRCGVGVHEVQGNGRVQNVVLTDGTTLPADVVVIGVGAAPTTDWLNGSGVTVTDGVVCDETLATGVPGVYAAGDVARWPNGLFGREMRLEHWTSASEQATAVARNALDPRAATAHQSVPYFWSDWYGQKFQMVGTCEGEDVAVFGDVSTDRWLALYRGGDRVTGALSLNLPGRIMKFRALIHRRAPWADAVDLAEAV